MLYKEAGDEILLATHTVIKVAYVRQGGRSYAWLAAEGSSNHHVPINNLCRHM